MNLVPLLAVFGEEQIFLGIFSHWKKGLLLKGIYYFRERFVDVVGTLICQALTQRLMGLFSCWNQTMFQTDTFLLCFFKPLTLTSFFFWFKVSHSVKSSHAAVEHSFCLGYRCYSFEFLVNLLVIVVLSPFLHYTSSLFFFFLFSFHQRIFFFNYLAQLICFMCISLTCSSFCI